MALDPTLEVVLDILVLTTDWSADTLDDIASQLTTVGLLDTCTQGWCGWRVKRADRPFCPSCETKIRTLHAQLEDETT